MVEPGSHTSSLLLGEVRGVELWTLMIEDSSCV